MKISPELQYYRRNRDEINERRRYNWKHFNRHMLKKQKEYRDGRREIIREQMRAWSLKHRKSVKELKELIDLSLKMGGRWAAFRIQANAENMIGYDEMDDSVNEFTWKYMSIFKKEAK